MLCDLSALLGANEKGFLDASLFGFGSNNNRLSRIAVQGKVRFWACEPMVGCLPDGGLLLAQTCGPEYKRRLPPPQGIRYEVSYDAGLTWAYTDLLYTMEPGSLEHHGTPLFAVLDEETMLVV